MAWLKPGGLFITDVRGKAGSTIYRKSIPGPMVADSLEEDVPVPGRQRRRSANSKCNCAAFKLADSIYTAMPQAEKQMWRDAVKKNARSGYTVWMSEAMHLFQKGLYAPDVPSESGGYSPALAVPGVTYAPPVQCLKSPVPKPIPNGYYFVTIDATGESNTNYMYVYTDCTASSAPLAEYDRWQIKPAGGSWGPGPLAVPLRLSITAAGVTRSSSGFCGRDNAGLNGGMGQRFHITLPSEPLSIDFETYVSANAPPSGTMRFFTELWSIPQYGSPDSPGAVKMSSIVLPVFPADYSGPLVFTHTYIL